MHRITFLIKTFIWVAIIAGFIYYPGRVRIEWLNYDIQTSVFFLFAVFFIVDRLLAILTRIDRYLFKDLSKNIKLSHYKSKIKSLKKADHKRLEKEKTTTKKEKQHRAEERQKIWHQRGQWVKKLFKK